MNILGLLFILVITFLFGFEQGYNLCYSEFRNKLVSLAKKKRKK